MELDNIMNRSMKLDITSSYKNTGSLFPIRTSFWFNGV